MDRWIYLLLDGILLLPWLVIFFLRKDLRRILLKTSFIGGLAGLVAAQVWFTVDYWQPPVSFLIGRTSPEDFFFGALIAGVGVTSYLTVMREQDISKNAVRRKKTGWFYFALGALSLFVFVNKLGINSIIVCSAAFLVLTAAIIVERPDLLKRALWTATLMTIFIILEYLFLFGILSPLYWDAYWLLADTKMDIRLFDIVPWPEIVWYFSWAGIASVIRPFTKGLTASSL